MRAPPDGYTLLMVDASPAINATLYEKLNFNFIRDTAPVGSVVRVPLILVVHPSVPAKTVPEFTAYAKANPGRITYGSAGIGSTLHVTGELFKIMTGVDLVHVPYRGGGPAIADLIGGQVQAVFIPAPAGIEYVRGGTIRALAVTAVSLFEALPDLPTIGEHVPSYEATRRLTPVSLTPNSRRNLPNWELRSYRARPRTLACSSRPKRRSGPR